MSEILSHDKLLELIEQRRIARSEKDWAKADAIKAEINAGGFWIKDHEDGGTSYDRIMPQMQARLQISTEGGTEEVRRPETEKVTSLKTLPKDKPKPKK